MSAVVQAASNGATASSPITATLASGATAGNLLVCTVSSDTTMTSGPSGFTQQVAFVGNQGFYVYTKTAAGGETAITVTPNGANPTSLVVAEVSGVTGFELVSSTASTQGTPGQTSRTTNAAAPAGAAAYLACYGVHGFNTGNPVSLSYSLSFVDVGSSTPSSTGLGATQALAFMGFLSSSGSLAPTASWTNGISNSASAVIALTEASGAATFVAPNFADAVASGGVTEMFGQTPYVPQPFTGVPINRRRP